MPNGVSLARAKREFNADLRAEANVFGVAHGVFERQVVVAFLWPQRSGEICFADAALNGDHSPSVCHGRGNIANFFGDITGDGDKVKWRGAAPLENFCANLKRAGHLIKECDELIEGHAPTNFETHRCVLVGIGLRRVTNRCAIERAAINGFEFDDAGEMKTAFWR